MIRVEEGIVLAAVTKRPGIVELSVLVGDRTEKAICYTDCSTVPAPGQKVLLNTTAVRLGLGTGGYHFVIQSQTGQAEADRQDDGGHIMKLRYTPGQFSVLSCEEPAHPAHSALTGIDSLKGMPVVAAELHSMLPAIATAIHYAHLQNGGDRPDAIRKAPRIAYVMTDGAALPLAFSNNVAKLKAKHLLTGSVTVGNSYGGDLEAVTLYSGLLAAKYVMEADIAIVTMGPGVVGTGTEFGHTGIEQGQVINAVHSLGGLAVACPRITFADARARHQGISHHTLTVLEKVALAEAIVPFPILEPAYMASLLTQLQASTVHSKHKVCFRDGKLVEQAASHYGLQLSTMGRTYEEDEAFFLAAGAAALTAYDFWAQSAPISAAESGTEAADKTAT